MSNVVHLDEHRPKPKRGGNNKGTRRRFGNIRKLPSGRWQASYLAPNGSRVNAPTTFDRKGDATTWLELQSAAITEGRWKPKPVEKQKLPTFADYSAQWLERRELKPRTRTEYSRLLAGITEHFGAMTLDKITAAEVREWHATLDPKLPTRRAHRYSLLRTIMGSAVDEELIDVNPCRIRGAGASKRAHEIKIATREEVAAMVDALPDRLKLMVLLAHGCGLRFGELTELRRKDIDMKHVDTKRQGSINVRRGVTWVDGKPVVSTPKSAAGIRRVHIPPHLLDDVQRHIADHAQRGREGLLFTSVSGDNHLNHGTWRKSFEDARKAAGREDFHFHDLRHTCFVNLAIAGATTRELMYIAGHTTPTMAMRYQHIAESRLPALAERLSKLMEGEQ